jgi:hypothetical protein
VYNRQETVRLLHGLEITPVMMVTIIGVETISI